MRMLRGCPDCGAMWREPTARFCGTCGARLTEQSDTSDRGLPRLKLRTPSQPARVVAGIVAAGLVVGALAWAASRPPRIQQIDVAVPAQTELQAPPDREAEFPHCVVDGLEQDCVEWQLDIRATAARQQGKLLVLLTRDGAVTGVFPETGEPVWRTHTPIIDGSLHPGAPSSRVLVIGDNRVSLLDAGTGRVIGNYRGWSGPWTEDVIAVVRDDESGQDISVVDLVTGEADEWRIGVDEFLLEVGDPLLTMQYREAEPNIAASMELRAYDRDGQIRWSVPDVAAPIATRPLVYVAMPADEVTRQSEVRAVDRTSGETVWSRSIGDPDSAFWGLGGAQGWAAREGVVLLQDGPDLLALEARTGEDRWRVPLIHQTTSLAGVQRPGEVVLSSWSEFGHNQLTGLDADTGETIWAGPLLENQWWDPSFVTASGLLTSNGRDYFVHHYDGTVTSFGLTGQSNNLNARMLSLDPLVVSSGYRLYGLDADIALSGEPQPRASE